MENFARFAVAFLIVFCGGQEAFGSPLDEDSASTKDQFSVSKDHDISQIQNGLQSLFTLGLVGGALALYSPKRRKVLDSVDRQGYYYDEPGLSYAQRVNQFEQKVYNRFAGGLSRIGNNARKATKNLRNAVRRTGQRSLNVVRHGANSVARLASATDRKLRGIARTAHRGLRRISSRVNRVGSGSIERMGNVGTNVGTAAIRGLYKVSRAYIQGLDNARKTAFNGLKRVGKTYQRGMSRVGHVASNLATAYSRGVARMGTAAKSSISDYAYDGVNRLGELASQSAAKIGGLATEVGENVMAVPKSIRNVAKDKKMRDCLLQAMCYVSTPFIDPNSNYVKRSADSAEANEEEVLLDLAELSQDGQPLRLEDCEAFKCEVVSLGKRAYEIVSKSLRAKEDNNF